jgi:hypothetical protein
MGVQWTHPFLLGVLFIGSMADSSKHQLNGVVEAKTLRLTVGTHHIQYSSPKISSDIMTSAKNIDDFHWLGSWIYRCFLSFPSFF